MIERNLGLDGDDSDNAGDDDGADEVDSEVSRAGMVKQTAEIISQVYIGLHEMAR